MKKKKMWKAIKRLVHSNKIGPILFRSWFDWIYHFNDIYVCLSFAGITFFQSNYGLSRNKITDRNALRAIGEFRVKIVRSEFHKPINYTNHKYDGVWASSEPILDRISNVMWIFMAHKHISFHFYASREMCTHTHTMRSEKKVRIERTPTGFFPFYNVFWAVRW